MTTAKCTRCGETKEKSEFTPEKRNRSGVKSWCKRCCSNHLVERRSRDEEHRKARIDYARARRQDEAIAARDRENARQWNQQNKERHLANVKKWRNENKDAVRAALALKNKKRRLRAMAWADAEKIREFYRRARELTETTGLEWHVDHIIPLLGRKVSGLHVPENLQVIPAQENRRKGNSHHGL